MKAFYFSEESKKLRYDDNRDIAVETTHTVKGDLELCRNGLHASKRVIDALSYAPGPILWLVDVDDNEMLESDDKVCSRSRKYLAEFDTTDVLRKFARRQAMINIEKIKKYCSDADYDLIVEWLETGNEDIKEAALSAAWSTARSAGESAWSTAQAAANSAASAAWSAANSAAWSAAWSAAESAWSAADSAWSAANDMLTDMIKEAAGWDI